MDAGKWRRKKPGVASIASAAGPCSRDAPAWLTYTASGNVAVCLKTDTELLKLWDEVMQEKPGAAWHCSREASAWLTYTASGSVANDQGRVVNTMVACCGVRTITGGGDHSWRAASRRSTSLCTASTSMPRSWRSKDSSARFSTLDTRSSCVSSSFCSLVISSSAAYLPLLAAWRSGNGIGRINEVTLRRAIQVDSAFHPFEVDKLSSKLCHCDIQPWTRAAHPYCGG